MDSMSKQANQNGEGASQIEREQKYKTWIE